MQELCRIIVKNALDSRCLKAKDKQAKSLVEEFQMYDTFRVSFMKVRREFRLGVFDAKTNTQGFIVVTHKKVVKEAVYKAMEDLRYLCRARNVDKMYAIASNLHEFQFLYYDR